MLLNDLDTVIRAAGCVVHEVPGWVGHNHGALSSVECIVIHHTGGLPTGEYPSYGTVRNGRPDLGGPLAQLGVGRSGAVYVFSNGVAWHAGDTLLPWMNNFHAIGIEVESVGTGTVWPAVQVNAAAKATAALCRRYGVPVSHVLGHKEVCYPPGRKVDPIGIPGDMPAFRTLVQKYITNPQGEDMLADERQWLKDVRAWVGKLLKATVEDDLLIEPDSYLFRLEGKVNSAVTSAGQAKASADQAQASVLALAGNLTSELGQVLQAELAAHPPVVQLDYARIVREVADELDRRNRDGNPATGQVS